MHAIKVAARTTVSFGAAKTVSLKKAYSDGHERDMKAIWHMSSSCLCLFCEEACQLTGFGHAQDVPAIMHLIRSFADSPWNIAHTGYQNEIIGHWSLSPILETQGLMQSSWPHKLHSF